MTRPSLPVLLRAASLTFALMWLFGAVSLVVSPKGAYEVTALALGGDPPAKEAYAAWAAVEAALGVGMLVGAFRGFLPTALGLCAMTGVLFSVKSRFGGGIPCGCMAMLPEPTINTGIARNAVLIAITLALAVLSRVSAKRDRVLRAAEAAGPAAPSP